MASHARRSRDSSSGSLDDLQNLPAAVAPLVYIDDRREFKDMMTGDENREGQCKENKTSKKLDKIKEALAAYNDYLDRRARARYVRHFLSCTDTSLRIKLVEQTNVPTEQTAENEGDVMNVPLARPFKNRYLDPNHPATNGGLIGLLSGGYLAPGPDAAQADSWARSGQYRDTRLVDPIQKRKESVERAEGESRIRKVCGDCLCLYIIIN